MTELYLYFWGLENEAAPWKLRDLHDTMWSAHVKEQHSHGDRGLFPSELVYEVWGDQADYYTQLQRREGCRSGWVACAVARECGGDGVTDCYHATIGPDGRAGYRVLRITELDARGVISVSTLASSRLLNAVADKLITRATDQEGPFRVLYEFI